MEVRNKTFHVGQIFRGAINGAILNVKEIVELKGPQYKQPGTYIIFQNEQGGRFITSLKTAQRLLLDPITQ